jgi:predicted DNA-binding ribbon-helix-helix protein
VHQCSALDTLETMKSQPKPRSRKTTSVRQSVTLHAKLVAEVRRVANERHLTKSRALVELAQRGVDAGAEARENLNATYRRFVPEADPKRKDDAGKDLIRAIFGKESLAEDPVR